MANEVVNLEPLLLPDLRRPERTPSLPGWVISRVGALRTELQETPDGFRYMVVLPETHLPTAAQKAAIESYLSGLRPLFDQTPENSPEWECKTLEAVTKLLWALPSQKSTEVAVEAKGEAYMVALESVTWWGTETAIREWYRGNCGEDENGRPYDYHWAPDPAALRRIARAQEWKLRGRMVPLEEVLVAPAYVDCTAKLECGRAAYAGLLQTWASAKDISVLTLETAAECRD